MEITIGGRKVEISRSVRSAVEEKVGRLERFLDGMERAEVVFTEERNPRISEKEVCEVTLHGHGHVVRARAAAPDALAAVDLVVDKLTHRLRKLKGKLVSRSHPRRQGHADPFAAEPLGIPDELFDVDEDSYGVEDVRIVRAKRFDIKPMTPPEAALQMELLGHDFFLFTNAETSAAAVVYRRKDGDVGLIEGS
ncbi:MAG: ribosome-associated translation inhibitor RaiA [Actinomycetota bacterium]|nr:ribosome-associated translation inhibitor RaiA [Actinomycetota bacterium]MDQ3575835.1 ribosome-associated translation inhibitor RaiA [Actinomycetota bacterium]